MGRTGLSNTGHIQDYGTQHTVIHVPYGVRSDLIYKIQHQVIETWTQWFMKKKKEEEDPTHTSITIQQTKIQEELVFLS